MCIYRRVTIIIEGKEAINLRKVWEGVKGKREREKEYISSINALNILKQHPDYLENSKTE